MLIEQDLNLAGQTIGVAVSGGMDSMALLHYFLQLKNQVEFELVALHVNHSIRQNSAQDALFVEEFCKQNNIKMHVFNVDVPTYAQNNKIGIEEAARILRYGVFDALLKKKIVHKIALAHHKNDQAETILLNLFRGAGPKGIKGMEHERKDGYIRPLLNTTKQQIVDYVNKNNIAFVQDQTNQDNTYSRNFLRNQILPQIEQRWPQVINAITNFAATCAQDDDYINSQVNIDGILFDQKTAKVPASYFLQHDAIVSRTIFLTLQKIGISKDVEKKHIDLIKKLCTAQNGSKINLPFGLRVIKEYDYITFVNKQTVSEQLCLPFKLGKFTVEGFGTFKVSKAKQQTNENALLIDANKVPQGAIWRFGQTGDVFTKFGGGTKKLNKYLIDKKIPSRVRANLPVLAKDNQILVVLGVEISDAVKIDQNTKHIFEISVL